jgi:hypothetical protein
LNAGRAVAAWLVTALVLASAGLLAERRAGPRGLLLSVSPLPGGAHTPPRRVGSVDLRDVLVDPRLPKGALRAHWRGFWQVREGGDHKLVARSQGAVSMRIDGRGVFAGRPGGRPRGTIALDPGVHTLEVTYDGARGPDQLRLLWSHEGEPRQDLDPRALFTAVPSASQQRWGMAASVLRALAWTALWAPPLLLGLAAVWRRVRSGRWPDGWMPVAWRRPLAAALRVGLPAAVVLYAGALRFEALVGRYAWEGPRWALDAARAVEAWHPDSLRWQPAEALSGGDPFHYLRRARAMNGFYEPDVREPVFPFVTRALLRLLDGRPLAVNAASALFSTLTVLATYLLGASAFSRAVGLGAALFLAVDREVVWWSVEGFRDDAFGFFVVASALAFWRMWERPTTWRAVLAGLLGGGACLTRITALSFLLPLCAVFLLARGKARSRRQALAVAVVMLLAVAGPYLLACAIGFGDPFLAVNFHTRFYRSRAGLPHYEAMSWLEYLRTGFAPLVLLKTGLIGLTSYPFLNKWGGLDYLSPWLGRFLAVASLAGLALFVRLPAGRLLLLVLVTSLLPYAFTWPIPGGAEWRFTLHAYPLYLIAAALALEATFRTFRALRRGPSAS